MPPLTDFPVGEPTGQRPFVHVRDITAGIDLYERLADTPSYYPASTVKLMTLLILRDQHSADWTTGTVTITAADVTMPSGMNLSKAGLKAGDVLTWEQLAYALIVPSGFDAALAIARVIGNELGGVGVARFVEEMNARAALLGMANALFVDPFGGSKQGGITRNIMSARDLSTLCEAVFATDTIARTVCSQPAYTTSIAGATPRSVTWTNSIPYFSEAGISVLCGKGGDWTYNNDRSFNLTAICTMANGNEAVVTVIGSIDKLNLMLEHRWLAYIQ